MIVKIKTWEDMENDFGIDEGTDEINCEAGFLLCMEDALPNDRIIELKVYPNEKEWNINNCEWVISDDMIERIIKENN